MLIYKITRLLSLAGLLLLFAGCVKDQDFDQVDEVVIAPRIETDLVFLKLTQENFLNSNGEAEVSFVSQSTDLSFLQDSFIQNDLTQIDFDFATSNSFRQSFNTIVTFLDEVGNTVYEFSFFVPGSGNGTAVDFSYKEVIVGEDLLNFKNAVSMQVSSSIILSGDPIFGELDFQSKARLYFEFN